MSPKPAPGRPLHDRLHAYLASDDARKLKSLGALALLIFLRPLLARLLAVATVASVGVVAGSTLTSSAPESKPTPAIKHAWLTSAGSFKVERIQGVPCPGVHVDLSRPPAGVGHTVEGSFEGGLAVFRHHYAPHFLVGRDHTGKVRIVQFCPLGEISAALRNLAGGVETNRWARAQIELAAFSKSTAWKPDATVMLAFSSLLYELRDKAGIPLRRGGDGSRSALRWGHLAGWYNHAEIPENTHWDMGAFAWATALKTAASLSPVVNPGHSDPVKPLPPARYRVCYWKQGLPKAVCLDVRYASLRALEAAPGGAR